MNKLVQLPNGDWVAPDRVSSVEVRANEEVFYRPSVVVRTKDGARIVIAADPDGTFETTTAESLRAEVVQLLAECDSPLHQ